MGGVGWGGEGPQLNMMIQKSPSKTVVFSRR